MRETLLSRLFVEVNRAAELSILVFYSTKDFDAHPSDSGSISSSTTTPSIPGGSSLEKIEEKSDYREKRDTTGVVF